MPLFTPNGVYLPPERNSLQSETIDLVPGRVFVPLGGAEPAVKAGERVLRGQCVGRGELPVYASCSGTVAEAGEFIVIDTDGEQQDAKFAPPEISDADSFIEAVRLSGCIGLGGGGHPTWEKLRAAKGAELLILNGMECEPFLTADQRCLMEQPQDVLEGARAVLKWLDIPRCVIALGSDKEEPLERLPELIGEDSSIQIKKLPGKYPLGSDKILCYAVTGRLIRRGQTVQDLGVLVLNVSTCAFLGELIRTGKPQLSRRITVDGDVVRTPCVLRAPIGTPARALLDFAEANMDAAERLVVGGPMMGRCITDLDTPMTQSSTGLLVFMKPLTDKNGLVDGAGTTGCLKCSACAKACPLGISPMVIDRVLERKNEARRLKSLRKLGADQCLECRACSYVCPAKRAPGSRVMEAKRQLEAENSQEKEVQADE